MSKLKPLVAFFFFLVLSLPFASADDYYNWPWGVSFQPFVIYADSNGALVGVEYGYYEEAGHFSVYFHDPVTLSPMELWNYFIFYVNESGAYYVDYMAVSGYDNIPLAFYKGWLYLFLLTSTNTSFPIRDPPVADKITIIRYCEGALQKIGEVPLLDSINVSMPYVLNYQYPKGKRVLYKVDDSIEVVATGNERNLDLKSDPYEVRLSKYPYDIYLRNKKCMPVEVGGNWIVIASKYKLPLGRLKSKIEPINASCAISLEDGILIVPPIIGIAFANESMWIKRDFHHVFDLYLNEKQALRPINVSLYFYKNNTLRELPLLHVSEKGVSVLPAPVKYKDVHCCSCLPVHDNWTERTFTSSTVKANHSNHSSFAVQRTGTTASTDRGICGVGILALLSLLSLILAVRIKNS